MSEVATYQMEKTLSSYQALRRSEIQNFIPWRAVLNGNSISTPCSLVFDASQHAALGWSLNILAKGKNSMNKLVEIVICWSIHKIGYRTDIKKRYNSVKLVQDDWCLQQYMAKGLRSKETA